MEKLGALWKRKSKKNVEYFQGNCNNVKIVIFANDQKRSAKSPDFLVYRSEEKGKSK